MIANEFTEATGDVYLSALVELGLVLFALTMVINAAAQLLIIATTRKGSTAGLMDRIARRNIVNNVMLTLTGICTVLTVSTLFLILGFLVLNGWRSLNWDFFTKLPLSAGETGGGMANAIVGSGIVISIAAVIGIPVGFLGGIYLAEFGGKTFAMLVRYTADLLNGVPSIVIGIFAWTVIVVPMHHFSAWAGGFALSLMMIPIGLRATEQFLRGVPNSLREGSLALGASKTRTIVSVIVPAAKQGILTGYDPGRGSRRRRNRAFAVYQLQQSVLGQQAGRANRLASRDDLYTRHLAVRRLASSGLGRRSGAAGAGVDRQYRISLGALSWSVRSKGVVT